LGNSPSRCDPIIIIRAGGFSAAYIDARKVDGVTFEFIKLPKESVERLHSLAV